MLSVDETAQHIVAREGGFVDDPDDPGGATNRGVTIHTLRRLGLDLDGDGDSDVNDLRRLTRGQAVGIFMDHYIKKPGLGRLPGPLQASDFDMYVNSGVNAVRIFQRLLRRMGFSIAVDGKIGPQTARLAGDAMQASPDHLVDAYGIARRNYYYALADHRPASRKYARTRRGGKGGWIKRAEEFIAPHYHLSDSEHRERVSKWA